MDSLLFLNRAARAKVQPLYVVTGDDDFLKRQVLRALRVLVLGTDEDDLSLSIFPGDRAELATVMDELGTVSFFGPRRLVVVENADPFVSNYRAQLEKAVGRLPDTGVLVLEVKSWPANTRLARLIDADVTLVCKAPTGPKLSDWCIRWAASRHGKQLTVPAATLLVELIGGELGQLDQELEKLAAYAGSQQRITEEDVDRLVGRSQTQEAWEIFTAIGEGKSKEALALLHRVLDQGDEPFRILGAFAIQVRRLSKVARLMQQGRSLTTALEELGINPFHARSYQQQLRHLGRERLDRLYDWLLEINMDLRGNSPLSPRTLLERFVLRLARGEPLPL